MTNKWTHLSKAPIVEGLIDLRIDRSPALTLDALKAACDELAPQFPSKEELRAFSGQITFSPESGTNVSAKAPASFGFKLTSTDQKWVAQFRLDGFTLSRLQPYTSWEELKSKAIELWNIYRAIAEPQKIVRVASRFINCIHIPFGELFDKTFTTTFSIPSALPQTVVGFLLRIVIPFENEESWAIVTQSLSEGSQDCTFDLDAFAVTQDGFSESEAWIKLEQLRGVKNRLFFESLTPDVLERFK
jgi:uncharacterized protein (TIGR04255 family)